MSFRYTSLTSAVVATNALAFVPGAAGNHGRLVYVFDDRIVALSTHSLSDRHHARSG